MSAKAVREKRAEIVQQMETLSAKIKEEKRNFSKDELTVFDSYDREQESLQEQAETLERVERVDGYTKQELRVATLDAHSRPAIASARADTEERNKAMAAFFYHGSRKSKPEYWRAAERQGIDPTNPHMRFDWIPWERRTTAGQLEGTNAAGGYAVAVDNQLMGQVDIALKAYGNVFQYATVIDTTTGASLPMPLNDDTSHVGEITPEGSGLNVLDTSFGQIVFNAYKYDTVVKASWEILSDTVIDLAAFLGKQMGIRIARKLNSDVISTGAGAGGSPPGCTAIMGQATLGATAGGTLAGGPLYADLVALYHSVDPDYRAEPGAGWVFNDNFLSRLRSIVDSDGRPLLMSALEGIAVGIPSSLLGKRFFINQAMATYGTASQSCVLFGDLAKIYVRRVTGGEDGGLNVMRLDQVYALSGMVGFLAWGRFDSNLVDAGTHPLKFLKSPAS